MTVRSPEAEVVSKRIARKRLRTIRRWLEDFPAFARENLRIIDKDTRLVPFELNRVQRRVWRDVAEDIANERPVRVYILKARQMGMSTLIKGIEYWLTSLRTFRNSLTVSHDHQSAEQLFEKGKLFWQMTPSWARPKRKLSNRKELFFARDDKDGSAAGLRSRILIQTADNKHLGASLTLHSVHLSEFARYEEVNSDARTAMVTLLQAVPDRPMTFVFIETTAYGMNMGYDYWVDRHDGYRKIFLSWVAHDEYTTDTPLELTDLGRESVDRYGDEWALLEGIEKEVRYWYEEEAAEQGEDYVRFEALCRLRWRREKIDTAFRGDLGLFRQEYPLTAEESFLTSGAMVFDPHMIADVREALLADPHDTRPDPELKFPPTRYRFHEPQKIFEEARHGPLAVYEEPQRGQRYAIGADVSEGYESSDFSCASVFKVPEMIQVAVYHEHIDPDVFASVLAALGNRYNGAWIAPEANSAGLLTINRLVNRELYGWLYQREVFDRGIKSFNKRLGWHTNRNTKPLMVGDLRAGFRDGLVLIKDLPTLQEMALFVEETVERGGTRTVRYSAPKNKNDDRVMAAALALQMARQMTFDRLGRQEKGKPPVKSPQWSYRWYENLVAQQEGGSGWPDR